MIRCAECEYCKAYQKYGNGRKEFFCEHPDQEYIKDYFKNHRISKMPGFLCFSKMWSNEVTKKASPAWCPKKLIGVDETESLIDMALELEAEA